MKRRETAGGLLPHNDGLAPDAPKQFAPDNVLVGVGNVEYRLQDLMRRRKCASIAGRHRDTQRLDKELQLLRAAMGLDPELSPETTRTHRNGKDPTSGENLMIASVKDRLSAAKEARAAKKRRTETAAEFHDSSQQGRELIEHEGRQAAEQGWGHNRNPHPYDSNKRKWWQDGHNRFHEIQAPVGHQFRPSTSFSSDAEWARKITTTHVAAMITNLHGRGYEYASRREGPLVVHTWRGFRGPQRDTWEVTVLGRDWAAAAVHNGLRVAAFEFTSAAQSVEKGIPLQITASTWDGKLDAKTRQGYAAGWAQILRDINR